MKDLENQLDILFSKPGVKIKYDETRSNIRPGCILIYEYKVYVKGIYVLTMVKEWINTVGDYVFYIKFRNKEVYLDTDRFFKKTEAMFHELCVRKAANILSDCLTWIK